MAKWGEGDPRWIVEERPDATNVNNWHWTEKNATPWSKDKLKNLLTGFEMSSGDLKVTVNEVSKLSGEASANNRKGKLIFFYEWDIQLKWTGRVNEGQKTASAGQVKIPNLSEENDLDEVQLEVSVEKTDEESMQLKQFMYNVGRSKIREVLGVYLKELKDEFSKGLILPKKGGEEESAPIVKNINSLNNLSSKFNNKINLEALNNTEPSVTKSVGCKLDVANLEMQVEFNCQARELYEALTKPEMVTAFSRSLAKVNPIKGGEFSLFSGSVSGKFEELEPNKSIKQTWRYKEWPAGHFSNVHIELEEAEGITKLKLHQTGVPSADVERTKQNWHNYYWHSIKVTFGYGSFLG